MKNPVNAVLNFGAVRTVEAPLNPAENHKNFFLRSIRSFRDFKNFCEHEESEENKKNSIEFFLKTTSVENISLDDFGNFLNTHFKNEEQKKLLIDKFISSGKHEDLTPQNIEKMLFKAQITDEEYKEKLLILGRIGDINICNITEGQNAPYSLTTFNNFVANKDKFDDDTKINTLHNLFDKTKQLIDHNTFTTAIKGFDIQDEGKRLTLITSFFANKNKFANNINCEDFTKMIKGLGINDEDKKMTFLTQFLNGNKAEKNITCKDFAEMIKNLGISDEDKKIQLITKFLNGDKAENNITCENFGKMVNSLGISDENKKMKLITEFLGGDKAENNITCENFGKMVNSLGISDENKKMKLITEFLGGDKAKISSLENFNFEEKLEIRNQRFLSSLKLLCSCLQNKNFSPLCKILEENSIDPLLKNQGVATNLLEDFINNFENSLDTKTQNYIIEKLKISNTPNIKRINSARMANMEKTLAVNLNITDTINPDISNSIDVGVKAEIVFGTPARETPKTLSEEGLTPLIPSLTPTSETRIFSVTRTANKCCTIS